MAATITDDCINCGACEPECPQSAITESDEIFVIEASLCCECVGFHDELACAAVCPVDCCVVDPGNVEDQEVLIARARGLHPDREFGQDYPSHL